MRNFIQVVTEKIKNIVYDKNIYSSHEKLWKTISFQETVFSI